MSDYLLGCDVLAGDLPADTVLGADVSVVIHSPTYVVVTPRGIGQVTATFGSQFQVNTTPIASVSIWGGREYPAQPGFDPTWEDVTRVSVQMHGEPTPHVFDDVQHLVVSGGSRGSSLLGRWFRWGKKHVVVGDLFGDIKSFSDDVHKLNAEATQKNAADDTWKAVFKSYLDWYGYIAQKGTRVGDLEKSALDDWRKRLAAERKRLEPWLSPKPDPTKSKDAAKDAAKKPDEPSENLFLRKIPKLNMPVWQVVAGSVGLSAVTGALIAILRRRK